jgi:hypothetical protein
MKPSLLEQLSLIWKSHWKNRFRWPFFAKIAHMQVGQCGNQEATPRYMPQAQGGPRHRCEGQLTTVLIKPFLFTLFRLASSEQGRRRPTPRFCTAGAGGVAAFGTCVGATA